MTITTALLVGLALIMLGVLVVAISLHRLVAKAYGQLIDSPTPSDAETTR